MMLQVIVGGFSVLCSFVLAMCRGCWLVHTTDFHFMCAFFVRVGYVVESERLHTCAWRLTAVELGGWLLGALICVLRSTNLE